MLCRVVITPGSSTVLTTGFSSTAATGGFGEVCAKLGAVPMQQTTEATTHHRHNLFTVVSSTENFGAGSPFWMSWVMRPYPELCSAPQGRRSPRGKDPLKPEFTSWLLAAALYTQPAWLGAAIAPAPPPQRLLRPTRGPSSPH